ncbi:MAG: GNAT family N-acetyltransferase [Candidatus Rokuibacteriota bacterium]
MIVRGAGRRDLDAIHALWVQLREAQAKADPRFALSSEGPARAREHREIILADPRTRFFVAEEQGRVVGYLHAQVEANDPAYETQRYGVIVDVIVREDRRREGLGARLLEAAKEWLRSAGVHEYRAAIPAPSADATRLFAPDRAEPLATTLVGRL